MLWEYVMPFVITLLTYMVTLLLLSREYVLLLRDRGLGKGGAWMVLILAIWVLILSAIIVARFLHMGINVWVLLAFFIAMLLPALIEFKNTRKPLVIGSRKVMLDGEEVEYYVYSGPLVNAFYSVRDRKIYVHKKLEELLSEDEQRAILFHECKHSLQASKRPYSTALKLSYYALLYWTFAGLTISSLASYIVSNVIHFPGAILNVMPVAISALAILYFMLALVSLVVIYLRWVWEHDADLYAARKIGAVIFAKALVKTYLASYLASVAKYISPANLSIEFKLEDISPPTWRDIAAELLYLTLSLRGFVDFISIITKPLEETHPPLYLRLRAIRTAL